MFWELSLGPELAELIRGIVGMFFDKLAQSRKVARTSFLIKALRLGVLARELKKNYS